MDHFLYEEFMEKKEFDDLWTVFKQLLTLSHGQTSVERGFSVIKEVVPNLEEMSFRSKGLVQNSMLVNNMKVADFVITEDLLSSCSHASIRHKMYLMGKKTDKEQTEKAKKEKSFTRRTDSSKEEKRRSYKELQSKWLKQLTRKQRKLREEKIQLG